MGARGKKRIRANGEVALGRVRAVPRPIFVPVVDPQALAEGLATLRTAVEAAGGPDPVSPAWELAYRDAQARLNARHERPVADAVLWRATFLDALLGWDEFRQRYGGSCDAPSPAMIEVAAIVPTHGAETSFDVDLFEGMLDERMEAAR